MGWIAFSGVGCENVNSLVTASSYGVYLFMFFFMDIMTIIYELLFSSGCELKTAINDFPSVSLKVVCF